jgi:hypothetical protein
MIEMMMKQQKVYRRRPRGEVSLGMYCSQLYCPVVSSINSDVDIVRYLLIEINLDLLL